MHFSFTISFLLFSSFLCTFQFCEKLLFTKKSFFFSLNSLCTNIRSRRDETSRWCSKPASDKNKYIDNKKKRRNYWSSAWLKRLNFCHSSWTVLILLLSLFRPRVFARPNCVLCNFASKSKSKVTCQPCISVWLCTLQTALAQQDSSTYPVVCCCEAVSVLSVNGRLFVWLLLARCSTNFFFF